MTRASKKNVQIKTSEWFYEELNARTVLQEFAEMFIEWT